MRTKIQQRSYTFQGTFKAGVGDSLMRIFPHRVLATRIISVTDHGPGVVGIRPVIQVQGQAVVVSLRFTGNIGADYHSVVLVEAELDPRDDPESWPPAHDPWEPRDGFGPTRQAG